jgi:hypothetical protein
MPIVFIARFDSEAQRDAFVLDNITLSPEKKNNAGGL